MTESAGAMGDIPHLGLHELAAHPGLPSARRAFVTAFLKLYGADPAVAHLLIEYARYLVFNIALFNFAAQDSRRPETWATVGRLKALLQSFDAVSLRQVDNLVADLRDAGFLELVQSEHDGRVRIVTPTRRAFAHDRDWLCTHYAPLTLLYPDRDYRLVTSRDSAFQVHHRRCALEFLPIVMGPLAMPAEVMLFFHRTGGYLFLAALLDAAGKDKDAGPTPVSYAGIADRFGYSRTHVRQVMCDAEAAGLVRLHGRGGHDVEILPALWAGHDKGIAIGMCLHDMIYARAAEDWRARH
jgi:hypothetical protein